MLNTILRNHLLSENLQWNYGSFNVYPYLSRARSQNFVWHLFCLLTTEGKNIVKLLAISRTCQFQFFFTDLPRNFWKIARLLGKIKNTITLRFISLYFLSKKSSSERTCPYWQWIVFTIKIKGHWPVPMVWKKTIHAVCGEDNIIIFQRENLNYLIVCFTQHTAVPCVFNAFDFCCRFVYRVLSVGHMKWGYKCCVVTHCAADILVVSLGLFTFTCIAFLLQLWIKTSNLDYSIWVMPK